MIELSAKLILIFLFSSFSLIENPCNEMKPRGGDEDWGEGIYLLALDSLIPIYEPSTHQQLGFISRDKNGVRLYEKDKQTNLSLGLSTLEWVGSGYTPLLMYKSSDQDLIMSNWKNDHGKIPFEIQTSELVNSGAKRYTYKEILTSKFVSQELKGLRDFAKLGINVTKSCVNLRITPHSKSKIIECVPGNDWNDELQTEMKVLEVSADWAKLNIEFFEADGEDASGNCLTYRKIREQVGWVKMVNETGFPNIWFSVTTY